jgi:adenylosuccinate synthase
VIHKGKTIVLHLIPSGILHAGRRCLIGNGVVVDLAKLREEAAHLESLGIDVRRQLGVSPAAHLILPYHLAADRATEMGPGAIGTTGRGIGFAYRDKASRVGLRVGDLFDPAHFREHAARNLGRLQGEFPESEDLQRLTIESMWEELAPNAEWVEPLLADVSAELHDLLARGKRVLLEGAQGTLLDLDHGTYPFVTSSPASAAGAPLGVGLGPRTVDRVIGVAKAYATRVGHGPFPTEMPQEEAARLREAGEEYGATTGRPRRCGWLDLPALQYAVRINGLDEIVITKLDVLDEFDEIRVAEAYEREGAPLRGFPASARELESCRPRWKSFPGWRSPTSGARRWDDLPEPARVYLEWIEARAGVPITTVSVGAGREAEIRREARVG